jgi:hypothetical protein
MKTMTIVGWTCLAIYAITVAAIYIPNRNATGDRALGLLVPFMMIPPILLFTVALGFAQYRGWATAVSILALLLTLPILFFGPRIGGNILSHYLSFRSQSLRGSFDDPTMSEIGSAIKNNDLQRLKSLIAANPKVDWNLRDRSGFTLFGSAVHEAKVAESLSCLRVLVQSGARFQDDAMGPHTRMLPSIVSNYHQMELLEFLLRAGADPNTTDTHGNPALLGQFMEAAKAKVLLDGGAELRCLRWKEEPYKDFDALMSATARARWDLALLYLERGSDPNYQTPDGRSAKSIAEQTDENVNRALGGGRNGLLRALAAAKR